MFKSARVCVGLAVSLVAMGLGVGVSHATADGEWGTFEEVSGLAAVNDAGEAVVNSLSCGSPGNCSAVGFYRSSAGPQGFVVSQVDGVWETFEDVPGLVAANAGNARVTSVSCASPGNCSAVGTYKSGILYQVFVVSQVDGVWDTFEDVPGLVAANTGGNVNVNSVSCGSVGNCSAGGYYYSTDFGTRAFVVSQVDGVWQTFEDVPGQVLSGSVVMSVSCASAGNCSAGGYHAADTGYQAFVVSQVAGTWGTLEDVADLAAVNTGNYSQVNSVSCASAGNCSAGGSYISDTGPQAFVVSQVDDVWQTFEDVPGLVAANTGGDSNVMSVSCASAGNCSAGGHYYTDSGQQAFVVSQVDGAWQTFEDVPGLVAVNPGGDSDVRSVSCASAGNCSAGGYYYLNDSGNQAFVVSQVDGVWQTFEDVPGLVAVNISGNARITSVSCATAGNCSAGGIYADANGVQAFVTSISTQVTDPTTTTTVAPTVETTTTLVTNLPATGNNSSSTAVLSLMLVLSGAFVVLGLRCRLS